MLDLDHFKRYNDEQGHQAGDDLLQRIAAVWKEAVRPGDVLARYGGEEFLATLPSCHPHGAVVVADRLRAVVPGSQTASVGTATWDGVEALEALIARADAALYQAKAWCSGTELLSHFSISTSPHPAPGCGMSHA